MPQPTLQDVHVNRPLTNISVAYLQEAAGVEFVADKAFPAVPVENKSDLYYTYARADFNRDEMQKRALSAESAGTGYNLNSTGTYNCDVWSLHKDVDDQIRSNSDSPLAPDRDATIFLTQKALIRRENQWVSKFFGTGIWTNQASGQATADSTHVVYWDSGNYPNGNPITDIRHAKTQMRLHPFAIFSVAASGSGTVPSVTVLISLLVCLIPTTIGGLLSAIGIAGMDRVMQHNVLAMSGKAVEAAGDVNTLLLDKTGTITLGNRQAVEFIPLDGVTEADLADAAQLSSLADETPEGRSIVVLAKQKYNIRGREVAAHEAHFIPFTAQTRMSGVDIDARRIRKGATDSVVEFVKEHGGAVPTELVDVTERIARSGGTPLLVADRERALGVIHLKDVVKGGMRERFQQLRAMGIRTVMITGDNPLTAAAIAAEAGTDDFLAQATPKDKMDLIKKEQAGGRLVAMTGDGTNDAPALAQADVGLAMNTGTMAAKEAGNMVDLDSNPTKLIEVVAIGKQLLMTRGALFTFSIANDIAKYFAILPAMFMTMYPVMGKLNIMGLHSPQSAVLSAVIFNALIIIVLIPLALRGVKYKPMSAAALLRRNLLVYGVGGVIAPFPGIWLIDRLLGLLHLA